MKRDQVMALADLIRDLGIVFPRLMTMYRQGYWKGPEVPPMVASVVAPEEDVRMVDGLQLYTRWRSEDTRLCYTDDGWHLGFEGWLRVRGWNLENYDGCWFDLTMLPTDEDYEQWRRESREREIALQGPPMPAALGCLPVLID